MVSAAVAVLLAVVDLVSAVDPLIGTVSYPKERIDNVHGFGKTYPGATASVTLPDETTAKIYGAGSYHIERTENRRTNR